MKHFILIFICLTAVSCTKKEITPTESADSSPALAAEPSTQALVTLDPKDRVCEDDTDCVHIAIHCSCGCGEGINKSNVGKYTDKVAKTCQAEQSKCVVNCQGNIRCADKLCTFVKNT